MIKDKQLHVSSKSVSKMNLKFKKKRGQNTIIHLQQLPKKFSL